jgi:asparagine synthase (glutamine-hydrolysing)
MCGICGTVGRAEWRELAFMTEVMAHRGPDGHGIQLFGGDPPAGLGHRRLAILDPTPSGAQPMQFGGRWWITYNGELYNFRELRAELQSDGEHFRSDSDTEVLLRLYAREGASMLRRLNGMFAFAIWDDQERRLFLARDRLGVKPLYYLRQPGLVAFASEVKALLPYLGRVELDPAALADYLTFLWVPDPKTAFRGIEKLPAGQYAVVEGGAMRIEQYWDLRFDPELLSEAEWSDRVSATISGAVRRQMVSDVPLGSFLSGGVDSSAVVAAMSGGDPVKTYTVGFDAADLEHEIVPDDLRYARRVGKLFGVDYHEEILQPDVLELLPKVVWHLEEPVADPAAISTYLICRAAGREMPVMLSGVGGDEVFAGYPRHLAYRISRLLDAVPRPLRQALEVATGPVAHPGRPGRLRGPRRNLWKFLRAAGAADPVERYLSFSSYYSPSELGALLSPDVGRHLHGYDPLARHRAYLTHDSGGDELSRLLYLDVKTFLPCLNLTYTDKMAMAASVEVRVPLLDDEVVTLAARIPSNLKLKGWQRKYIFKRSQERILPRDVIWRRKAGFGAPVRSWLVRDLAPLVADLLSEETLRRRNLIDPRAVERLWKDNVAGRSDNSLRLYALLSLELWCSTFADRTWSFDDEVATAHVREARVAAQ